MPPVAGVTRNADARLNRSSRIGVGAGTTAPFGSATLTVIPWYGAELRLPANVASAPDDDRRRARRRRAVGPGRHSRPAVMSAGACTTALACSIGTDHSVPIAFHTSSSWSANAFIAPRTRYVMS